MLQNTEFCHFNYGELVYIYTHKYSGASIIKVAEHSCIICVLLNVSLYFKSIAILKIQLFSTTQIKPDKRWNLKKFQGWKQTNYKKRKIIIEPTYNELSGRRGEYYIVIINTLKRLLILAKYFKHFFRHLNFYNIL